MIRLILAALLWPFALLLVELPAWLSGHLVVRVLALFGAWRQLISPVTSRVLLQWRPKWAWVWGNEEDGIDGPHSITPTTSPSLRRWIESMEGKSLRQRVVSWSAWRNSAANLRFSRYGLFLRPEKMRWRGNSTHPWRDYKTLIGVDAADSSGPIWCWARQGWKSGLWIIWPKPHRTFGILRVGWKVYPGVEREIDKWVGFSVQGGIKRKADFGGE